MRLAPDAERCSSPAYKQRHEVTLLVRPVQLIVGRQLKTERYCFAGHMDIPSLPTIFQLVVEFHVFA
jgi:hypothetical protein